MPVYTVRHFPSGQKGSGLATKTVSAPEPMTVRRLLAHIAELGDLPSAVCREGTPAGSPLILLNGRSVHAMDGLDTPLADGDTVSILTPVSGG